MRFFCSLVGSAATLVSAIGLAQEPLCNPCVDPPVRERSALPTSGTDSNVITADDIRTLGVISIGDVVNQLRENFRNVAPTGSERTLDTSETSAEDVAVERVESEASNSDSADGEASPD